MVFGGHWVHHLPRLSAFWLKAPFLSTDICWVCNWFCKQQAAGPPFDKIIMKSSTSYILSVQFFFDPTPPRSNLCLSLLYSVSQKADLYHVDTLPHWLLTRTGQWEAPAEMERAASLHHWAPVEWSHSHEASSLNIWVTPFPPFAPSGQGVTTVFHCDWIGCFTIPCWSP